MSLVTTTKTTPAFGVHSSPLHAPQALSARTQHTPPKTVQTLPGLRGSRHDQFGGSERGPVRVRGLGRTGPAARASPPTALAVATDDSSASTARGSA